MTFQGYPFDRDFPLVIIKSPKESLINQKNQCQEQVVAL